MANTYNKNGAFDTKNKKKSNDDTSLEGQEDILQEENSESLDTSELENEENYSVAEELLSEEELILCDNCMKIKSEAEEARLLMLADTENFKKRLLRDKEEQVQYAGEKIMQDIIPALDNFDLAIQYANNDACQDIITGIQMTRKLLLDSLKPHGLVLIDEVNVPFDPEIHEAIGQEASEELEKNHVVRFMQNGYLLKNRLLRSAKVIVSQ